jgi:hypothetical protein
VECSGSLAADHYCSDSVQVIQLLHSSDYSCNSFRRRIGPCILDLCIISFTTTTTTINIISYSSGLLC